MKVYKYTVNQITPRGKYINVFEKVVQSEMSHTELSDYLKDKYLGLSVYVEEVKEIETIGSTNKRTYISYEKMYEQCIKLQFTLEYSKDEDFKKIIELNEELEVLKENFKRKVIKEVDDEPKYKSLINRTIKLEVVKNGYNRVILVGDVRVKDLNLVQD